eukprot:TRINITY_DN1865_c0_g1_i1.p2 TRINITY_DN1865_c0_g1~~TRINITY_DN1865_c0_g1_i1.p2  ORF type:complete len:506 (+),score=86.00 TRINITY_DN1865_c0_g1_i1:2297-3814(+)
MTVRIRIYHKMIGLKQQEEKIKKSVDKIRYEQAVIKKQKTEIRQAQEGTIYAKQKIIDLGRLRIMLNNERSEIQMEKEDLCQERVNLEQLKQEVGEIQQKSEEDTKALEEEKLTLVQLQSELYEKSKALDTETYELGEKEIFNLRQDALLMLKERLISRVYERKVLSIEKYQENSQQRKITDKATPVHEIDEDSNLTNEKAKPRALSGINSKSETETLRDEQESLVNASGISIITANFPSSRGLSILKKEQELEEQMKMLEEEKRKLRAEKEMIDKEKEEVEFIKAQIEKEAERGKPFSFAKYEEEKKNDLFPAAKEVKLEEVEQKEMEDQDELDFKPDPSILEKINENITKGNALFEQQPSSTIEPQFSEEQFSSEGPIVRVSLGKSISVDETKSPDKDWNDDAIRSGLMFRSHSEDSSEESIIIKEDKVYDEPKRAKYGIRPLVPNSQSILSLVRIRFSSICMRIIVGRSVHQYTVIPYSNFILYNVILSNSNKNAHFRVQTA